MQPRLYPYAPERDVYRLLQVEPTAEPDEIMAAIRRLARTFHPDHNRSPRATEEMQVVYAVRSLLIDPTARARYDHARHRFMAEAMARQQRDAAPAPPRRGAHLPPRTRRRRPFGSRIALTGRALLAALVAILDAFAPARGRLLTTSGGAVATPLAAEPVAAPRPLALRILSWDGDGEVVLDPEPLQVAVAVRSPAPVRWEPDGEVVLEPVPMALPRTRPIPVGPEPQATAGSFWETSARVVAAASEVEVRDCPRCGLALSVSASFCRRCGTSQARSA